MSVLSFNEHLRAIEVRNTNQHLWCCSDDLFCIHLLSKDTLLINNFGCMENPESRNSPDQPEPTYFRELTHVHIIIA